MKKVIITLVNYFGEKELVDFIRSQLLVQKGVDLTIAVVDNGSRCEILQQFAQENPAIRLFQPNKNLGYLGAAFFAYKQLVETERQNFDTFILSNFDLEFPNAHTLEKLVQEAELKKLEVFGPQIINIPDGGKSNPMYEERISLSHLNRLLKVNSSMLLAIPYQLLHRLKKKKSKTTSNKTSCYAIHGSMMCFASSFFKKSGTLDYPSFLYGEEIFIAEQCLKQDIKIGFIPSIEIIHKEHITTGSWKTRKHMQFLHDSLSWIKAHYFSQS
ncbi:MAG: glycosyltransferase [Flavobacteriales bacterium]